MKDTPNPAIGLAHDLLKTLAGCAAIGQTLQRADDEKDDAESFPFTRVAGLHIALCQQLASAEILCEQLYEIIPVVD